MDSIPTATSSEPATQIDLTPHKPTPTIEPTLPIETTPHEPTPPIEPAPTIEPTPPIEPATTIRPMPTIEPAAQIETVPSTPAEPSAPERVIRPPPPPSVGDLDTLLGPMVRLLGEVVGETVRQSVEAAVAQVQQMHTRERDDFARHFEAALERQDSRLRELLENQDARLNTTLGQQAKKHAEEMRAIVGETLAQRPAPVPPPSETPATGSLEELQETLRLGFSEVRGALDRHHHELMNTVRAELRPLAQAALAHLSRTISETAAAPAPKPASDGPSAVPTPPARASPARPPPAQDERTPSQRHPGVR